MIEENSPHLAEIELRYKSQISQDAMPELHTAEHVVEYLRKIWNPDTLGFVEEFYVLYVNSARKLLGWSKISQGGRNATIVDISTVLAASLLANAHSIILAHNHPSGNTTPSRSDINLTQRLAEGLKHIAVKLDDHIILTPTTWVSMNDKGLIAQ